jgi:hypothetical protein
VISEDYQARFLKAIEQDGKFVLSRFNPAGPFHDWIYDLEDPREKQVSAAHQARKQTQDFLQQKRQRQERKAGRR